MKKIVILIALGVLFCSTFTVKASGITDTDTGVVDSLGTDTSTTTEDSSSTESTTTEDSYSMEEDINNGVSLIELPDVTIDDVDDYIQTKGGQIIYLWQKIALFVILGLFIFACIVATIGGFGSNKKNLGAGLLGAVLCALAFTGVYYAPQILEAFRGFMAVSK